MPFTVEDFRDLIRIVEERPEWRADLRRLVLTDDLLSLPEQVLSLRAQTEQGFQELAAAQRRTEEQVAGLADQVVGLTDQVGGLAAAQRRTEEQVAELTGQMAVLTTRVTELTLVVQTLADDVDDLKGESLERRYRERAPAYFARVIRRAHVLATEELVSWLDDAVERGEMSEVEAAEVAWADLVVRGRRREDGAEVYFVVEVSWGIGPHDVERAVHRAALLAQLGTPALPMVAGKTVTDEAARLMRTMSVWQLNDGQVVPPEHATDSL